MHVSKTVEEVRAQVLEARRKGLLVGLVPTMGALHAGHVSLIDAAKAQCDFVVVSLFVNPTQFGPNEDLAHYPRPFEADRQICQDHGVDVLFSPHPKEMYPQKQLTWVVVEKLTEPMCGRSTWTLPRRHDGLHETLQYRWLGFGLLWPKRRPTGVGHPPNGGRFEHALRDCHLPNGARARRIGDEQPESIPRS